MKVLSVRQPFATLLCMGVKDTENRTWRLPAKMYGERVLIHASAQPYSWKQISEYIESLDSEDLTLQKILRENNFSEKWLKDLPTGAIIGSVVFVDYRVNYPSPWAEKTEVLADESGLPYYGNPTYNWVAKYAYLFPKDIKAKGNLNFWNYPNIQSEPDEYGIQTCNCQICVDEQDQVLSYGGGDYRCKYCGGKWYK